MLNYKKLLFAGAVFLLFVLSLLVVAETPSDPALVEDAPVAESPTPVNATVDTLTGGAVADPPAPLLTTVLSLLADKLSVLQGEIIHLTAQLTGADDTPLEAEPVDFYANEQHVGTQATNAQGLAELFWDTSLFSVGDYALRAEFTGSDSALASIATGAVVIEANKDVLQPQAAKKRDDYLKLVSNTEHCVGNCQTIYQLCPSGADDATFDIDFKDEQRKNYDGLNTFRKPKDEITGEGFHVRNLEMEYKKPIVVTIPVVEACQKSLFRMNNQTGEQEEVFYDDTCQTGTRTDVREGTTWEQFTPTNIDAIPANGCFELRVKGKINWGDYVDNVVSFAGYEYDEYAPWVGDVMTITSTADFDLGNVTNTTTASGQIKLTSTSSGYEQSVFETFENNSIVQWNGGTIESASPLNGTYSIKLSTGDTDSRGRTVNNINANNNNFNLSFNFKPTVSGGWQVITVIKSQTGAMANANSHGIWLGTNVGGCEGNDHICSVTEAWGWSDTGLACKTGITCTGVIEVLGSAVDATYNLYVNGTKVSSRPTFGSVASSDMDWLGGSSNGGSVTLDDIEIWNATQLTTVSPQGYYLSQKIDTALDNESLSIAVVGDNFAGITHEARVAATDAGVSAVAWSSFTNGTDFVNRGRWMQYRINFTQGSSLVNEVRLTRQVNQLGPGVDDEASVQGFINTAANSHLTGAVIYANQSVSLRNSSNSQVAARIDSVVVWNNKRWLFNYRIGSEAASGIFNITPVVYSWEMQNLTQSQIEQQVGLLINSTK